MTRIKSEAASGVGPCAASDKTTGAKNHTPAAGGTEQTKIVRILRLFTDGHSLNCIEAESAGDHCLNSTVSDIQSQFGLPIDRVFERVLNRYGKPTRFMRYWLAAKHRPKARKILRTMQCRGKS